MRGLRAFVSILALSLAGAGAHASEISVDVIWLVVVDDLHLPFIETGRLRTLVGSIVDELAQDGDLVAIQTTGPSSVATEPFGDSRKLSSAVKRLTGNGLKLEDVTGGPFTAGVPKESVYRAQISLSAAAEAGIRLKPEATTLAVLLISNGYPINIAGLAELRSLVEGARRDGTPIFTMDPQGQPGLQRPADALVAPGGQDYRRAARESLILLAELTGGFAVLDERDWNAPIDRIKAVVRR